MGVRIPSGVQTNTDLNMDNLSGKVDYYHKDKKKKDSVEVIEVVADKTELQNESKEIAETLNALIVKSDALYAKFSIKELSDTLTTLRMAKDGLKKLTETLYLDNRN